MNTIWGLLLVCSLYFIPTVIAFRRNHGKIVAIYLINIMLGWTVIGWFLVLFWACVDSNTVFEEQEK